MALLAFYGLVHVDESSPVAGDAAGVIVTAGGAGPDGRGGRHGSVVRVSDILGGRHGSGSDAVDNAGVPGAAPVAVVGAGGGSPRDPRLPPPIPVVKASTEPRPAARPTSTTSTTAKPKPTTTTAKPKPTTTTAKPKPSTTTTTAAPAHNETGAASWYEAATPGHCAHRSIPMGTVVTVVNVENDRRITCRVNDRGPFIDGRVIDLSEADFEALTASTRGLVPVRLEWR